MKKVSIFIIIICFILSMMGCSKDTKEIQKTQNYMNALINEINEGTINVTPIDNENANSNEKLINAKNIIINLDTVSNDIIPKLNKGNRIRIVYNEDSVTEDPLKIDIVFNIYLINEEGEVIPNN